MAFSQKTKAYPAADERSNAEPSAGCASGVAGSDNVCSVSKFATAIDTRLFHADNLFELEYVPIREIGKGSFGKVHLAILKSGAGTEVAIKEIMVGSSRSECFQEVRMLRKSEHRNVVVLNCYFYNVKNHSEHLNIVMEYFPESLQDAVKGYQREGTPFPLIYIRLYTYQVFRALGFLAFKNICHGDVKLSNVLVDQSTGVVKLCDFGAAQTLLSGGSRNQSMGTLNYRAPELLYHSMQFTTAVDLWSAGCILASLLRNGKRVLPRTRVRRVHIEQMLMLLGKPSRDEFREMNPDLDYPQSMYRKCLPASREEAKWAQSFETSVPSEGIDIAGKLMSYAPSQRPTSWAVCSAAFYDELRAPGTTLPNGVALPPLFDFNATELLYHQRCEEPKE